MAVSISKSEGDDGARSSTQYRTANVPLKRLGMRTQHQAIVMLVNEYGRYGCRRITVPQRSGGRLGADDDARGSSSRAGEREFAWRGSVRPSRAVQPRS